MRRSPLALCFIVLLVLLAGCAGRPPLETSDRGLDSADGISIERALIIATAKSNLGVPYRWGGNDPAQGLDCSGLSELSYRAAGFSLPRITDDQFQAIPKTAVARPGDLLFFGAGSRATHVGIYLGNQQMIHAPGSGRRVELANLSVRYWQDNYLGAGSLAP